MNLKTAEAKNLVANYANFATFALIGLAVNPILASLLGPAAFGSWKACQRFFDVASVADGRATQALKWVVAHRMGEQNNAQKQRDLGASAVVWLFWLPLVASISVGIVALLPRLVSGIGPDQSPDLERAGLLLASNVVLAGLLMLPDAVLVGTNQGYRSMTINTLAFVISNIVMVVAAEQGYGISALAGIVSVAAVLNSIATWIVARRSISWWGFSRPRRVDLSTMFRFSGWVLGWAFTEKLLLSSEVLLLSVVVGVYAVTDYTFMSYVVQFSLAICLMTANAYTPQIGSMLGRAETGAAARLVIQIRELVMGIATIGGCCVALLNKSFISVWVGPSHYMGAAVNIVMIIAFVQLAVIRCEAQIHDTALSIRSRVLVGGASTAGAIAVGVVAYRISGSISVMLGGVVLVRGVMTVTFPRMVEVVIPGLRTRWRPLFATLVLIGSCWVVGFFVSVDSLFGFLFFTVISLTIVIPATGVLVLSGDTRRTVLDVTRSMYRARLQPEQSR